MSSLIDSIIQYIRNRKKRHISQQTLKDEMKILSDACKINYFYFYENKYISYR